MLVAAVLEDEDQQEDQQKEQKEQKEQKDQKEEDQKEENVNLHNTGKSLGFPRIFYDHIRS